MNPISMRCIATAAQAAVCFLALAVSSARATVSYTTPSSVYSQSYDGLPGLPAGANGSNFSWAQNASVPGWYAANRNASTLSYSANANGIVVVNGNWANATDRVVSFGTSDTDTDRSIGFVTHNNNIRFLALAFVNNSGTTLNEFTLGFTAEQWRTGTGQLAFDYNVSSNPGTITTFIGDPATPGWTAVGELSFQSLNTTGPTAQNGRAAGNFAAKSYKVQGFTWAPGATLLLRWAAANNTTSNEQTASFGINDLTFSAGFTTTWTITASAGVHGTITPAGDLTIYENTTRSFTIAPDLGYGVADVLVDGASVGPVRQYMFSNVTANRTISASFREVPFLERTTAYGAGADTYGNSSAGTGNYGAATVLEAKAELNSTRRLPYLRFDLGGLNTVVSGATADSIRDPSLSLTVAAGGATYSYTLWGLVDGTDADRTVAAGGWTETGLTWNNAPGRLNNTGANLTTDSGSPTGTPLSYGVLIGQFTVTSGNAGTTATFGTFNQNASVSPSFAANLEAFLRADTNGLASFAFQRTDNGNAVTSFHSKENTTGSAFSPTLHFGLQPIPSGTVITIR